MIVNLKYFFNEMLFLNYNIMLLDLIQFKTALLWAFVNRKDITNILIFIYLFIASLLFIVKADKLLIIPLR